jgi:hypothetical protein
LQIDFICANVLAMDNLRFIILDEFDGKPLRAFSNKASALWFLENRPNCKLHILTRLHKAKVVPMSKLYEECLF